MELENAIRSVVVQYSHLYAHVSYVDQHGKVLEQEVFRQPFRLEARDVDEEATETFQIVYQHLQDSVLWYATARDDDETEQSDDEQEDK